jgi:hypothetical protein
MTTVAVVRANWKIVIPLHPYCDRSAEAVRAEFSRSGTS